MTKTLNIRIEADRTALVTKGFTWALTQPRGENIGRIISKHKSYAAAEKAAHNCELQISDLLERH